MDQSQESDSLKRTRRQVYGKTREAVAAELHKLQHAKRSGISIEPAKLTLDQYLNDWIADVVTPRVRASTLAEYQRHVDRVTKAAGGVALQNWKAADIRALWAEFEDEGLGARTRRAIHATMNRAMGDAVQDGLITINPISAVRSPREKAPERKSLSPAQVRDLLESVDTVESPQTIALVTEPSTPMKLGESR